jgi:hypothetical protein
MTANNYGVVPPRSGSFPRSLIASFCYDNHTACIASGIHALFSSPQEFSSGLGRNHYTSRPALTDMPKGQILPALSIHAYWTGLPGQVASDP